jgi:kynurenine formamidase
MQADKQDGNSSPKFDGKQPKITIEYLHEQCAKFRNWGKWGPEDELGTLNHVTPADIVEAAKLVRTGKVISMALPFDQKGPAFGLRGRFNPIHLMIATGAEAYAGVQDPAGMRYADDIIIMPLQCGTQWDALSHVFYGNQMWNGYDIRLVDTQGAKKNGIEKTKAKMVGRGVLLDVPRAHGVDTLPDGYAISAAELDYVAGKQHVEVRRADFVIMRTGSMGARLRSGVWGTFGGGEFPGLAIDTAQWAYEKQIAAFAADTHAVECRPNPIDNIRQPWHWIVLPNMGLTVGEYFFLEDLAEDCAADGVYEFFFTAPSLPFTGAVGCPTNPLAIK